LRTRLKITKSLKLTLFSLCNIARNHKDVAHMILHVAYLLFSYICSAYTDVYSEQFCLIRVCFHR